VYLGSWVAPVQDALAGLEREYRERANTSYSEGRTGTKEGIMASDKAPVDDYVPHGQVDVGANDQACNTCKHLYPDHATCEAFPDGEGIPDPILDGYSHHLTPYPGDHGIQYEWNPYSSPKKPDWAP
jgi:hypothetical protein